MRADAITFLAVVHERGAVEAVEGIRDRDVDSVSAACDGYLRAMEEDAASVPRLLSVMEHEGGAEFSRAAASLGDIAGPDDMDRIRRTYGQVEGRMREETKEVLESIIARNPELEPSRDFILSLPVYPDEAAFERFLDNATEYVDVRYRRSVLPLAAVPEGVRDNVLRALRRMSIRLYNEADNLEAYGPDKADRLEELTALVAWAGADLASKRVVRDGPEGASRECPRCGEPMVMFNGRWTCPGCGPEAPARRGGLLRC